MLPRSTIMLGEYKGPVSKQTPHIDEGHAFVRCVTCSDARFCSVQVIVCPRDKAKARGGVKAGGKKGNTGVGAPGREVHPLATGGELEAFKKPGGLLIGSP